MLAFIPFFHPWAIVVGDRTGRVLIQNAWTVTGFEPTTRSERDWRTIWMTGNPEVHPAGIGNRLPLQVFHIISSSCKSICWDLSESRTAIDQLGYDPCEVVDAKIKPLQGAVPSEPWCFAYGGRRCSAGSAG
jgi:hypothetical protein